MYKNHGAKTKYFNEVFGFNSRLDSIQASILDLKLQKIDKWIENRISSGKYYDSNFKNQIGLSILDNNNSTFNYYSILVSNGKRDKLKDYLSSREIAVAIYYPKTLPSLPAHNIEESFPVAEKVCDEILSLPIWPGIKEEQLDYVVKSVNEFFNQN